MHDIGKAGIPDHIRLKPGPLTAREFDIMKTHAAIGFQILNDPACGDAFLQNFDGVLDIREQFRDHPAD